MAKMKKRKPERQALLLGGLLDGLRCTDERDNEITVPSELATGLPNGAECTYQYRGTRRLPDGILQDLYYAVEYTPGNTHTINFGRRSFVNRVGALCTKKTKSK